MPTFLSAAAAAPPPLAAALIYSFQKFGRSLGDEGGDCVASALEGRHDRHVVLVVLLLLPAI
mgnify:FL=1